MNNKKILENLLKDFYNNDDFIYGIENLVFDSELKTQSLIEYIKSNQYITCDHISQYALRLDMQYKNENISLN